MESDRVVHGCRDSFALEAFGERIPVVADERVLRVHAGPVRPKLESSHGRLEAGEQLVIASGDDRTLLHLPIESLELREQHRALDRVQPAVDSEPRVMVSPLLAVMADLAHRGRELIVIGKDRAALAVAAERLAREEARAADRRQSTALPSLVSGAEALRGVLDHRDSMASPRAH